MASFVLPVSDNIWDFDPTSISGCCLWLDGADPNTMFSNSGATVNSTVGGSVVVWKDKSISANNAQSAITNTAGTSARSTSVPTGAFTNTSGSVTLTVGSSTGIFVGSTIVITNVQPAGLQGTYIVTAVNSGTSITFVNATASASVTVAGTIVIYTPPLNFPTSTATTISYCVTTGNTTNTWGQGFTTGNTMTVTGGVTPSTFNVTAPISSVQAMFSVTVNGNGTTATYTVTPSTLALLAGSTVVVFGFGTAAFNGTFTMATQTTTTFTVANATNSGGTLTGGTVYSTSASYLVTVSSTAVGSVSTATAMGAASYVVTNTQYPTMASNAVAFNGNQYFSLNASLFPLGASNATYFFISKGTSGSNRQNIFHHGQNGPSRRGFESGQTANSYYFSPGNTIGNYPTSGTLNMAVNNLISVTLNNQICAGWANGSSFTTNNNQDQQVLIPSGGLNTPSNNSVIGMGFGYLSQTAGTFPAPFNGNISEILVFNTALSNADRQNIEGYLAWKWGLQENLPTSHPYYPSTSSLSSISPRNYAGLALWLDAADANTVLGSSPVTSWNDKSGNGRNATAVGTDMTYVTSGRNGLNTIRGPQAAATNAVGFTTPSFAISTTNSTSIFVLYNQLVSPTSVTSADSNFIYMPSATNLHLFTRTINGDSFTFYYTRVNGVTGGGSYTPSIPSASIFEFVYTPNTGTLYGNGTQYNTITTTAGGTAALNSSFILNLFTGAMQGNICELLIYNSALTTTQRQQIEGYLAYKWGLQASLPVGHPYAPTVSPVSSISPTNYSGLSLWLDTADVSSLFKDTAGTQLVTTNGDIVRRINDKSGNSRNATTSATTNLYTTSQSNGNSAIQVPSNSGFATPSFTLSSANTCTLFIVALQNSPITDNVALFQNNTGSSSTLRIQLESTLDRINVNSLRATSSALMITRLGFPNIYSVGFDSSAITSFFNGTSASGGQSGGPSDGSLASPTTYAFATNTGMNGYLYEILLYNTSFTTTQRQEIEGYLAWKWGLQRSLPSSHPYAVTLAASNPVYRPFSRNFVPTDIDNCQMWIDPADRSTVTVTGSNVTAIRDKSGNGNNATNVSSTITYASTLNGLPVMLFPTGGASNFLATPNLTRDPVNHTYFFVIKYGPTSFPGQVRFIEYRGGLGSGLGEFFANEGSTGTNTMYLGNNNNIPGGGGAQAFYTSANGTTDAFYGNNTFIVCSVRQNALYTFTTNGVVGGTPTGPANSKLSSGSGYLILGGSQNAVVGDAIIYNAALNNSERQMVEGYLFWKWGLRTGGAGVSTYTGLSVPTSHPYYKFPPPELTPLVPTSQFFNRTFTPLDLSPTIWLDSSDTGTYTITNNRIKSWRSKGTQTLSFAPLNSAYTLQTGPGTITVPTGGTGTTFTMSFAVLGVGTMTGLTVTVGGNAITGCTLTGGSRTLITGSSVTISNGATVTLANYTVSIPNITIPAGITIPTGGTGTSFTLSSVTLGTGTLTGLTVTINKVAITGCTLIGGSTALTTGSSVTIGNNAIVDTETYTATIPTGGTGTSFTISAAATGTAGVRVSGVPLMISGVSIPNCAITVGETTLTTPSITVVNAADVTVQPGPLVNTATRGSGIYKPYLDFSPGGNFFIGPSVTTVGAFNPTAITITAESVWFDGTTIVISSSPRMTMVLNQQITFNGSGTVIPGTTPIVAGTIYYIRSVFTLASTNINFPTNNITISLTTGGAAITGLTAYTVLSGVTATTGAYTYSIPTSIPHRIPNGAPVALVVDVSFASSVLPIVTYFGNIQSVPSTTTFTMLIPSSTILTIPAGTTIVNGATGTSFLMSAAPIGTGILGNIPILIAGVSRTCTITAGSTTITINTSITLASGATVAAGIYGYPSGTQITVTGHVEYGTNPLISGNLNADGTTLTLNTAMPHNLSAGCIVQPSIFGGSLPAQWAPYTSAVANSNTGSFVGYISAVTGTPGTAGLQLTVTSGTPPGVGAVLSGTGVTTGTVVSGIIVSGTSYLVNISQNVPASTNFTSTYSLITFLGSISGTTLTYSSGTLPSVGMVISGTGITNGTYIVSAITGTTFVLSATNSFGTGAITGANYSIEFTFPSTNWPILPSGLNNSNAIEVNSYNGTSVSLSQANTVGNMIIFNTAVGSIPAGAYYVASIVSGNTVTFSSSRALTPFLNAGALTSGLNIPVFYILPTIRIMSAGTSNIASFNNAQAFICGIDNANRKVTVTGMTLAQPTAGTANFSLIVNPGIQYGGSGTVGANYLNGPYVVQSVPTPTSITISLIPYSITNQYGGLPQSFQIQFGVTYTGDMANYGYKDFRFGGNGTGGYSFSDTGGAGAGTWTQALLIYPTSSFYLDATVSPTASFNTTTTTVIYVHHAVYPPLRQGTGSFFGDSVISTSRTANTLGGADVTSGGRDFGFKHGGASLGTRPSILHNNNQGGQALNNNANYVSTSTPYRIFSATFNSTGAVSGDVPTLTKNIAQQGWRFDAVNGTFGFNAAYISSAALTSGTVLSPTVMRLGGDTLSPGFGIAIQGALLGGIAELLVFNTALTREQRQLVEGFLAQKYGCQLTLANDSTTTSTSTFVHPYRLNSLIPSGSIIYSSAVSLWLDAADSSTFLNSGLSTVQWNDKSGNGRNATNYSAGGSVGSNITYVTNSQAGLGGVQIINTASANGLTTPSTFPLYTAQQFSFFVVGRVIGGRNGGFVSNGFSFGQWCIDIGGPSSNNVTSTVGTNGSITTAVTPSPAVNVIGTTFLVSLSVTPTSFTQGFETLYINGQNKTTGTGTISTNLSINLILTRDSNTTTTTYYELIGFANALSDIQRQQVEGYLAWKWQINSLLPTTHAYYRIRP